MFSPKKFTLPQLAACVLLSFYFKMSYRDFEELLLMSKELRDAPGLTRVPHYSTLNRMYHRFRASHLDKMNETLLSKLNKAGLVQEEVIAVDSTGFRPTNASAYFQTRRGKPFRAHPKNSKTWSPDREVTADGLNRCAMALDRTAYPCPSASC